MSMLFGPENIVSKTISEASENELIGVLEMEQAIVKARYSTRRLLTSIWSTFDLSKAEKELQHYSSVPRMDYAYLGYLEGVRKVVS